MHVPRLLSYKSRISGMTRRSFIIGKAFLLIDRECGEVPDWDAKMPRERKWKMLENLGNSFFMCVTNLPKKRITGKVKDEERTQENGQRAIILFECWGEILEHVRQEVLLYCGRDAASRDYEEGRRQPERAAPACCGGDTSGVILLTRWTYLLLDSTGQSEKLAKNNRNYVILIINCEFNIRLQSSRSILNHII